jgi:L-ascorbate metabolism protein UlaG (beta-lactamase superfamily)
MDIFWHGHSCFTIKGKSATIVTDPFELGTKLPKLKANIVSLSEDIAAIEVEGDPKVLDWPGEFEVSDVAIEAIRPEGENSSIFIFAIDGIKICHLGFLTHELHDDVLDHIGDVDILMVPVGGGSVLDAKTAQKVVEAIEPRIVIPMLYNATETTLDIKGSEDFLKALGKMGQETVDKYSVAARANLPEGSMGFVIMEPKL